MAEWPLPDGPIPREVLDEANQFASRFQIGCQCEKCSGPCKCGTYERNLQAIVIRRLRQWERQRFLRLHERIKPILQARRDISMGSRWVIEDETRRSRTTRHPESSGFAIDHEIGERWRRFNQLETKEK
jgi:hypothetical protein